MQPNVNFFVVYCKTRKKTDKYLKVNRIKNKYIIDIKKVMEEEELNYQDDKDILKILIFNKILQAIEKKKDIYYIPDFSSEFSIYKLLNIRKMLSEEDNFNVLVFYNEFKKDNEILEEILCNLSRFTTSQIIKDY